MPLVLLIALAAGLFSPAVAGGWTSQLPRVVTGAVLDRGSALDAMTYSAASLAGPALAALVAGSAAGGPLRRARRRPLLVALAVPSARWLSRFPPSAAAGRRPPPHRQMAAGFAAIIARPAAAAGHRDLGGVLRRDRDAAGCCPVLGAQRLGGPARGALLISAMAAASLAANAILARRPPRGQPDAGCWPARWSSGWAWRRRRCARLADLAAVALTGAGEGRS